MIAVVLIIGFTVAIAAIIMTWGTGFIRGVQKETEEAAEKELTLAVEALLDVSDAKLFGDKVRLTIENTGSQEIESIKVRVYGSDGIDTVNIGEGLEAYGVEMFEVPFDYSKTGTVEKVEALPVINYGGEMVVCSNCVGKKTKFKYPPDILINGGF